MFKSEIGTLIADSRSNLGLTQDQFGRKYNVSGPAIFKFEKSYVSPSLELWLQIAKDIGLTEQVAVILWVKSKLPKKYQGYIVTEGLGVKEKAAAKGKGK